MASPIAGVPASNLSHWKTNYVEKLRSKPLWNQAFAQNKTKDLREIHAKNNIIQQLDVKVNIDWSS